MNLLANKDILRNLIKTGDQFNTINGGSVAPRIHSRKYDDGLEISIQVPSLNPDAFKVSLNVNKLIVSGFSQFEGTDESSTVPVFLKIFEIPSVVRMDQIEAIYEENRLLLRLPFEGDIEKLRRDINIRHNH